MERMKEVSKGALAGMLISAFILLPSALAFKAGLAWGKLLSCHTTPKEPDNG